MAKGRKRRLRRRRRLGCVVLLIVLGALIFGYASWAPFPYRATVVKAAGRNHLSPYFVAAVIRVESGFRPDVVSRRGAVGLMQLMPSTAQWIAPKAGLGTGRPDLTNPTVNITLGAWYLKHLLVSFHRNSVLALAAYNGGPDTVGGWLTSGTLTLRQTDYRSIPFPETRHFVARVDGYEHVYRIMYGWLSFR